MVNPSNFDKAVSERDTVKVTLNFLEGQLTSNTTTPLSEAEVDQYLEIAAQTKTDTLANQKNLQIWAPSGTDLNAQAAEFNLILARSIRLHAAYHGLKNAFPVSGPTAPQPSTSSQTITLPRLELPKFSGDLQEWVSFRDLFVTAVHNSSLSKVEKLTQLKSLLTGEASRQVRSLVLSEANYDIAWKALQERYENNRKLLFAIMKRLFQQQAVQPNSAVQIRALIDTTKECIRSLEVLALPTHEWDAILLFLLFQRLDNSSRELWEQSLPDTSIPPLSRMYEFLEQRARALSAGVGQPQQRGRQQQDQKKVQAHHVQSSFAIKCQLNCDDSHPLFRCPAFRGQAPHQRREVLRTHCLCFNCLQAGHSAHECNNQHRCKTCQLKHHTMVHINPTEQGQPRQQTPPSNFPENIENAETVDPNISQHNNIQQGEIQSALLATAAVRISTRSCEEAISRAFLDSGSMSSFITESCAKRMKLKLQPTHVPICGLSSAAVGVAKFTTSFVMKPHFPSSTSYSVNCLVVGKITSKLPTVKCDPKQYQHLQGLQLADPDFWNPASADILLGADVFWDIINAEKKYGAVGQPLAVNSSLGWLVAGTNKNPSPVSAFITNIELNNKLQQFWEQETLPNKPTMTPEELQCEETFYQTHTRDLSGRFVVTFPWKKERPQLGASRQHAIQRFKSLENRLFHQKGVKDIEKVRTLQRHWEGYKDFMREYVRLGHMSLVPADEVSIPRNPTYYIPHHFVTKESSTTTKLRVVYDASARTSSGYSLNDGLLPGPQLQDHILDIMLRFRTHPIAITADLEKMYRQIRVGEQEADLQRILWREDPSELLQEYRLNTVTYGTTPAAYLAVKCLQQLASDGKKEFPVAAKVLEKDFYVDDLLSGTDTKDKAITTVQQLVSLCRTGGFELRKWTSNDPEVLASIPEDMRETKSLISLDHDDNIAVKTLGVFWNPAEDQYHFKIDLPQSSTSYSKRTVLSEIAKIFDPLGWLAPVIITLKIFMQELWKLDATWDTVLPPEVQQKWMDIKSSLPKLEELHIPRCVIPGQPSRIMLCGFSDASEKAFSAVVYVCCWFPDGSRSSHLLTSKTRVTPVKPQTLPRLELSGAVLLAELLQTVKGAINKQVDEIRAFMDSTIVLSWILSHPSKWKTFVRNRIQLIHECAPEAKWFHVSGVDNPADCATRGITPVDLIAHPLWWRGNEAMFNVPDKLLTSEVREEDLQLLEQELQPVPIHHTNVKKPENELITMYSSFVRLQRIVTWLIRFRNNCQAKANKTPKQLGPLTTVELNTAHATLIKVVQDQAFRDDIKAIQQKKEVSRNLLSLRPFISLDGLLRVGGRLKNANVPFDRKHPILIPRSHHVTQTIIRDRHLQLLHAGPASTLADLNQRYWIVRGRDSVRFELKKCTTCTRHAAATMKQLMGDLPFVRVNPSRPFSRVGVDYAGPYSTRSPGRSKVVFKSWLAIFVCFATRALHLEVVSSLSTDAFFAALQRFMAKRGKPSDIYSDCGTNFVGASKTIKELVAICRSTEHNSKMADKCSSEGVQWHFNPPGAPHFGGLWEAGVRSVKHHLARVVGNTLLTYEEMDTLVSQIEAILNSRPLIPASADPSDLTALTPAHFLIGAPLTAIPEPDLTKVKVGHLDRWQIVQQQRQLFWKRWSGEFITRLQQRPKWCKVDPELRVNDMVIVKDERLPPLKWKLGRVAAVHPGPDNHVRVVTVKTKDGEIKRPIVKLCRLPITEIEAS